MAAPVSGQPVFIIYFYVMCFEVMWMARFCRHSMYDQIRFSPGDVALRCRGSVRRRSRVLPCYNRSRFARPVARVSSLGSINLIQVRAPAPPCFDQRCIVLMLSIKRCQWLLFFPRFVTAPNSHAVIDWKL